MDEDGKNGKNTFEKTSFKQTFQEDLEMLSKPKEQTLHNAYIHGGSEIVTLIEAESVMLPRSGFRETEEVVVKGNKFLVPQDKYCYLLDI